MSTQRLLSRGSRADDRNRSKCIPVFTNPDKFVDAKIEMLRAVFCIELTVDDISYLRKFKTESEINMAVKKIINKYWE